MPQTLAVTSLAARREFRPKNPLSDKQDCHVGECTHGLMFGGGRRSLGTLVLLQAAEQWAGRHEEAGRAEGPEGPEGTGATRAPWDS